MSDKKQIDRLFQEKFKDFEVKPNDNIWANIQNKIEQPKEKTEIVFPFWFRLTAIAAALILLFTVGNIVLNTENKTTIVDTNNDDKIKNNTVTNKSKSPLELNNSLKNNEDKSTKNTIIITDKNTSKNNKISKNIQNNITRLGSSSLIKKNALKGSNISSANASNDSKVNSANKNILLRTSSTLQKNTQQSTTKNTVFNTKSATNNSKNSTIKDNTLGNNITYSTKNHKSANPNKTVLNNNNAAAITDLAKTDSEEKKEEEKLMEPDSANSSNAIEEAIVKNEDFDKEEEEKVNRWSVNANAAPVYYNTLGKGSHIHDQFIDNKKNGEINTSYGINVGYVLNKKLKIRSGINKLNLSYDTANVIIYENVSNTPNSSPLRNINFVPNSQGQNISVLSPNSLSVQEISGAFNDNLNAALSQRLSYLEVPVELEYTVTGNRFGFNLIGGFSTFFLNDNEVVTEVDNRKTKIGEANNINNISFSANAGIGIDYKFSKAIKFNLEPTFKYQINAYNETSGDFKPYIIGVYTGISYKF